MNQKNTVQNVSRREKITKANSTVFITAAIAAVVIMFSLMATRFLWQRKSYNDRVIKAKVSARNDLKDNLSNLEKLSGQYSALDESPSTNGSTILHSLPPTYDYPALATAIESLAQQSGVKLAGGLGEDQSSSAIATATTSAPQEVPLDLEVSGSYESIVKFTQNIERSIRPIVVKSVTYSGGAGGLKAHVSAVTYYQPARSLDVQKVQVN